MKFPRVRRLFSRENRYVQFSADYFKAMGRMLWESSSGIDVNEDSALSFPAVYACVRLLAEDVAKLPLILYRRRDDNTIERARDHPLSYMMHDAVNPNCTSFAFREFMQGSVSLRGNAIAAIGLSEMGRAVSLHPMRWDYTQLKKYQGRLVYVYQQPGSTPRNFEQHEVLHLSMFGTDGAVGLSPIALHKEAVGLGMAAQRFGAKLFGNGARVAGVIEHPAELSKDAYERMNETWTANHGGVENANKTAILEGGAKWHQISISPDDAQFLGTRGFQLTETAMIFRVPPYKLQDYSRATFSNVEHTAISYVIDSLMPHLGRWESTLNHRLLSPEERESGLYFEFLVDGLLRGDTATRYEAYSKAILAGWMEPNEARIRENMNPRPDGVGLMTPANMITELDSATRESLTRLLGPAPDHELIERASRVSAKIIDYEIPPEGLREIAAEQRAAANDRRKHAHDHESSFAAMATRLIRAEKREVMKLAKKNEVQRTGDGFLRDLDDFYVDYRKRVASESRPSYEALGKTVAKTTLSEINEEEASGLDEFIDGVAGGFAAAYTNRSRKELGEATEKGMADGITLTEAAAALFVLWEANRVAQIAKRETVQSANAITKYVYNTNGITRLKWQTFGENCPYCDALDGKVVGIQENFINKGDALEADGQQPFNAGANIGHAPLHGGCDCSISPG